MSAGVILDRDENGDLISNIAIKGVGVENNRIQSMDNRVPNGYSLYVAGASDDIAGGVRGGIDLRFDLNNTAKYFQLFDHYYAIGARAIWQNCNLDNYFNATLIAPASTGATQAAGDFNKVEIIPSSGLNVFVPASPGTGSWSIDLTEKLTGTQILKMTPVPATGNNGWFDYDSVENTLTVNPSGQGGYNLYDFDVNLHAFGRKVWGTPLNGGTTELDVSGLVGKLLFNSWKIKVDFGSVGGALSAEKVGVIFLVATKKNI